MVTRINPLRFKKGARAPFEETIKKMRQSADRFDVGKVGADELGRAAGPPEEG